MTRFWLVATIVAAAVALLIVGAVSGDLRLVYVSIGLAALALLLLIIGVAVWRDRVFGGEPAARGAARPGPAVAGAEAAREEAARRPPPVPHPQAPQPPRASQPAQRPDAPGRYPPASGGPVARPRPAPAVPAGPAGDETLVPAGRQASASPAAAAAASAGPARTDPAPAGDSDAEVLVVPGIARYHRPGCMLIRFLGDEDTERTSRADAEASGSVACRACRP